MDLLIVMILEIKIDYLNRLEYGDMPISNQLKTPAKVPWAFEMVSQFGSLGYTIMGKTADLRVVQKTIVTTLHKEGKP